VLDNYATHKTSKVKEWLIRHPRFHLHFTPTSSSWLNLVERWFAELTTRKLRRSAHRSVTEPEADVRRWVNEWNSDPKPFVWTKPADQILGTLATYCKRINDSRRWLGELALPANTRFRCRHPFRTPSWPASCANCTRSRELIEITPSGCKHGM